MMKTLWNAIGFIAIIHLLAMGGFCYWLYNTNRLDQGRIDSIRAMLSLTIEEETIAIEEAEKAAQLDALADAEKEREENPTPPSAEYIDYRERMMQAEKEREVRRETELREMRYQLSREQKKLNEDIIVFEQEKKAWDDAQRVAMGKQTDEQFLQTVKLVESLPPKGAKAHIVNLVNENQMDVAVAILDAMKSFSATKVLKEFKNEADSKLATELLERIRTLGTAAELEGNALNADSAADTE